MNWRTPLKNTVVYAILHLRVVKKRTFSEGFHMQSSERCRKVRVFLIFLLPIFLDVCSVVDDSRSDSSRRQGESSAKAKGKGGKEPGGSGDVTPPNQGGGETCAAHFSGWFFNARYDACFHQSENGCSASRDYTTTQQECLQAEGFNKELKYFRSISVYNTCNVGYVWNASSLDCAELAFYILLRYF